MKSGFKDPAEIKNQKPKDKPVDGKNTPWDFTCPQYDQRTSCFVKAGTNYGVGFTQPIGHEGNAKQRVNVIPFGRPKTMDLYEEK